ncbi:enoyl-CoA hydratase/isomerase family protein [Rhodoligotrophos ferricapiens]|uniref:enoyl-CoA hydratase/isomerase family protein n=1 Tax=Rhodoligotrophos ferricapiens TaxID=3069264 RepID=UPI00315D3E4C
MTIASAKDPVQLTLQDEIAILTINRPQANNALSPRIVDNLLFMLQALEADNEIKVLIIQGAGESFCAGEDLGDLATSGDPEQARQFRESTVKLVRLIGASPKIVISKIRGVAYGAGLDIVLAADFAIASPEATFGASLLDKGAPEWTSMVSLSRNIAAKHALRILLGAEPVSAADAVIMGLIGQVVPEDELDETVDRLAERLIASAPQSLKLAKRAFRKQLALPIDEAYAFAIEASLAMDEARPRSAESARRHAAAGRLPAPVSLDD